MVSIFLQEISITKSSNAPLFILFRYDMEATYFDDGVRTTKRKQLEEKLLQVMPPYGTISRILDFYTIYCCIDVGNIRIIYLASG